MSGWICFWNSRHCFEDCWHCTFTHYSTHQPKMHAKSNGVVNHLKNAGAQRYDKGQGSCFIYICHDINTVNGNHQSCTCLRYSLVHDITINTTMGDEMWSLHREETHCLAHSAHKNPKIHFGSLGWARHNGCWLTVYVTWKMESLVFSCFPPLFSPNTLLSERADVSSCFKILNPFFNTSVW